MSAATMSVVIQFGFIPASFILRINTRRRARRQSKRHRRKRLKRQGRCGAARADRTVARRLLRRCVGAKKIVRLHRFFLHQISLESKLNGRQKVKGGNGSISASISTSLIASLIASLIPLNLGVGCAPSCCRFSDSETSWVLAGGAEGSFLCSLSSRFSGGGGGVGSPPQGVAASWGARRSRCLKNL